MASLVRSKLAELLREKWAELHYTNRMVSVVLPLALAPTMPLLRKSFAAVGAFHARPQWEISVSVLSAKRWFKPLDQPFGAHRI